MKRILLLLVVISILRSCKTSRKTVITETKTDTIFITKEVTGTKIQYKREEVMPPLKIETTFNPCDSLYKVKPTSVIIKTKYITLKVKDTLGQLKFEVLSDSIKQIYKSSYESKLSQELEKRVSEYKKSENKKTIVTVWNKWTWIFLR